MTPRTSDVTFTLPLGEVEGRPQWPMQLSIIIVQHARQGMKFPRKKSVSLYVLLGAAFVVVVCLTIRDQRQLYPNPESGSIFLKNYTPRRVIESFASDHANSAWADQKGATAGRWFVTIEQVFGPFFAIQNDKRTALMQALSNDIDAQIREDGGWMISRSGDPMTGFQFKYRIGKSLGMVTLSPLAFSPDFHNINLPSGVVDVKLTIAVTEHWYPAETDAIEATSYLVK